MLTPESKPTDSDPSALFEQFQAGIWRFLRALGCEASLAEDLTQETFLRVLRKPIRVYDGAATASYLRRVAYSLFVSHQRRHSRVVAVSDFSAFEAVWTEWVRDDGEDYLTALRACVARLSRRARAALEHRYRDKLSRTEIAERLRMSEHGAKNLMQRAKKRLRDCVQRKLSHE